MHQVPRAAHHQFGVFTIEQAMADGWNAGALKYWTARGALLRLRRGAYALAATNVTGRELERIRLGQLGVAAALRIPAATVSHGSAVAVRGLPLLDDIRLPCITLEPSLRTRPAEVHVHRQPIPSQHLDLSHGFRVTSVARSCIDLTREGGLAAGLLAAEAAVQRGLCTVADLEAVYDESCRGRAGLATGRRLLQAIDEDAQSPLESISRLAFDGLAQPQSRVLITSAEGQFIAHAAFYWDWLGLVGEVEDKPPSSEDELRQKHIRHDALTEHGLVTECWGWDIARRPAILRKRIERAIYRAAEVRATGLRVSAIVRPEWQRRKEDSLFGPHNAAFSERLTSTPRSGGG